jgi:uncharacterized protein (TIGR03000 family)
MTPALVEAKGGGGGGGHGGGGHGGGGHGGGGHSSAGRGGGSWHGGSTMHSSSTWHGNNGMHHHNNHRTVIIGVGGGWGWGGWGWGWDYPGYNGYGGFGPSYYNDTPAIVQPAVLSADTYNGAGYQAVTPDASQQPPDANADPNKAGFIIRVPDPNAEIWFQNYKTQQKGVVREYESGALKPDQTYTFHLKARWTHNGQPVEAVRDVQARAGQNLNVVFTPPVREQIPAPNNKED